MRKWEGFQRGINLGGYLSQCEYTKKHFDTFITRADIKTIADWGLDHVRLPLDYNVVQNPDGTLIEDGFEYINNCMKWCREYGLNMVLDLHKTAGYFFDNAANEKGFFQDEELIQRFLNLWEEFAIRYGMQDNWLAFELLNEVVNPEDNDPWMEIVMRAYSVIRTYAPKIKIMFGGYWNNSLDTLQYVLPPMDENIVYDVHCYAPLAFTHQKAPWMSEMPSEMSVPYPVTKKEFEEKAKKYGFTRQDWAVWEDATSPEFFERAFKRAIDVTEERNGILYCGEYGVINGADLASTLRWYQDIHTMFERHQIGRAAWNYKQKDFGIADECMEPIRNQLILNL